MKSAKPGPTTSGVELSNVSQHGLWLFVDAREYFLSFDDFPWFRNATIAELSHLERPTEDHLYWPELDVDLTIQSMKHPEDYPLVSRKPPGGTARDR